MIEYKAGNLLTADVNIIVHGCNCKLSMGAGIAKQIKKMFPEAHTADLETMWGDKSKLGTYTKAETKSKTIVNAYTQFNYTKDEIDVDYDALIRVFTKIKEDFPHYLKIGMPRIGCGLAGGDWNKVEFILDRIFDDRIIEIYDLPDNIQWIKKEDRWINVKSTL